MNLRPLGYETAKKPDVKLGALGGDPSRGGADKTVNAKRYGHWVAPLKKHPGESAPDGPVYSEAEGTSVLLAGAF